MKLVHADAKKVKNVLVKKNVVVVKEKNVIVVMIVIVMMKIMKVNVNINVVQNKQIFGGLFFYVII
jgi:hypothetical protein